MSDISSKYQWTLCESEEAWSYIIHNSTSSNLFFSQLYLNSTHVNYNRFIIQQGQQIKAGVCVIEDSRGTSCTLDDLVIYNGLIIVDDFTKKEVRRVSETFLLTEFTVNMLTKRYKTLSLALPPSIQDLRPFLWHNYHENSLTAKFRVDIRYTSYLDISSLFSADNIENSSLFRSMDTLRQRHFRMAVKHGATVSFNGSTEHLIDNYYQLMASQGEIVNSAKLNRIKALIEALISSGQSILVNVLNSEKNVIYSVAYAWDNHRAYYLFGAGSKKYSEPWMGTFAHLNAFMYLSQNQQISWIDLEGVNSPDRGKFKMSFGGQLVQYHEVHI